MICPNCQHENPENAKFCNSCGAILAVHCSNCGNENPAGSKFCNICGHKLAVEGQLKREDSPSPHTADIQALIPEEFAAKLESARSSRVMVGERRIVTMLFCDIKGSTAAAEQLDPEEWAEVINQAFEYMIAPVYKYEGMVARLMGDGILAFFGAPVAHEDDPQRAILAGLDIVRGIKLLKEKIGRDQALDIDVRVGINTGLVMVGQVGSDLQMEYTAIGDAINLAARMEQTAEPGTVQISEQTYKRIARLFEFEELGRVAVKGKVEPVLAYRPLRRKQEDGRLRVFAEMNSPLVGRNDEIETMLKSLANFEHGIGGVLCLIGEAGLGKSRLIKEMALLFEEREKAAKSGAWWIETASLSFETTQAYALFQRLLRRLWDIGPQDQARAIREKITSALSGHAEEEEVFQILLGVESQQRSTGRQGEAYKRELYRVMSNLWEREAARSPIVLVLEDLHWTDPASVELLIHLIGLTEQLPLLLLCALRPDRGSAGWQIKQSAEEIYPHRFTAISLQALDDVDANVLVDNLLAMTNLPPRLRRHILEKTDGNPLFVEEVVHTLIDRGLIIEESIDGSRQWQMGEDFEEVVIPGNLQTLLIARIDRLEVPARRTLQLASVIGRSFYYRVLDAIYETDAPLISNLEDDLITLQRKELVRQAARLPEPEYLFRHVLTQEAAYSTILLRERPLFHRRAGEAIEKLFPDRLEEFYPVLARHFRQAADPRAVRYETLAGDAAFRLFAISEARSHYARALELSKRNQSQPLNSDKDKLESQSMALTHLYLQHGRCLELQAQHAAAQENYADLEAAARENEDLEMLLTALMAQAIVYAIPSPAQNTNKGQVCADEALILAQKLDDQKAEAKLLWIFMLLKLYSGYMSAGIPFGEQSIDLARRLGMREQLALSLQDLGLAYLSEGRLNDADAVLLEAAQLWKALNNLPLLAENRANTVYIRAHTADFDEAIAVADESLRIAKSIENDWGQVNARAFVVLVHIAQGEIDRALEVTQSLIADAQKVGHPAHAFGWFYLGWLYTHLGAYNRTQQIAERGIESSAGFPPFSPISLAMAVRQQIRLGDLDKAGELLSMARQLGSHQTLQMIDLVVDMVTAEYFLARRDYVQAQNFLSILLDELRVSGARYFLADVLRMQSVLLQEQGQLGQARASLKAAQAEAEQINARIVSWQILAELGDKEAAQKDVDFIADNISDLELRQTFLAYARSKIG